MADNFASRGHSLKKKKHTWWSNDKTIIELGYHKISWFVSVSQINYLPQPLASPQIDMLAIDKSQYFAQPRPKLLISSTTNKVHECFFFFLIKSWIYENHICELRSEELNEGWSWQLYTQLLQLRKESLKQKNSGRYGIRTLDLCDTKPEFFSGFLVPIVKVVYVTAMIIVHLSVFVVVAVVAFCFVMKL